MTKKSKVINLGCRLNFFESEVISNLLEKNNLENKIVINTCAVTNQALQKSIQETKKAIIENPNFQVVVTGCASQVHRSKFLKLKGISEIIDNNFKTNENFYLDKKPREKKLEYTFPNFSNYHSNRTRATLQIQQGCNHRCTFCIIPYGRGDAVSLPLGEISNRISKILKSGYKEIILTGVDLTSYGEDLPGNMKLGGVLKRIFELHPNLPRLRLSSIDPAEIDDNLMDLLKNEKRLMPHLHLSVQSGDNLILKRMKRRHNREEVLKICEDIKKARSEMTFGADIIVGFPTEEKDHFQNTVDLVNRCKFSNLHIFPFSPKAGTPAEKMPQINKTIKKERTNELRKIFSLELSKQLDNLVGKKINILYESDLKSYSNNFHKVMVSKRNQGIKPGTILDIKVNSKINDFLVGEI